MRPIASSPAALVIFALAGSALGCAQAQVPSNVGGDGIDRAAATAALVSIEPTACSELAGPRGKAHVRVVFAPSGNVSDAKFDRGPDNAATSIVGTPRGDCLLERCRELNVPPFKGAPTSVGRQLTLE